MLIEIVGYQVKEIKRDPLVNGQFTDILHYSRIK